MLTTIDWVALHTLDFDNRVGTDGAAHPAYSFSGRRFECVL